MEGLFVLETFTALHLLLYCLCFFFLFYGISTVLLLVHLRMGPTAFLATKCRVEGRVHNSDPMPFAVAEA